MISYFGIEKEFNNFVNLASSLQYNMYIYIYIYRPTQTNGLRLLSRPRWRLAANCSLGWLTDLPIRVIWVLKHLLFEGLAFDRHIVSEARLLSPRPGYCLKNLSAKWLYLTRIYYLGETVGVGDFRIGNGLHVTMLRSDGFAESSELFKGHPLSSVATSVESCLGGTVGETESRNGDASHITMLRSEGSADNWLTGRLRYPSPTFLSFLHPSFY